MGSKKSDGSFSLAEVLDLNEAAELHGKLMALRGNDLTIDASAVQRVGAQCVQVLMAAARNWEEDKKVLKLEKASDAFKTTMQLTGIDIEPLLA